MSLYFKNSTTKKTLKIIRQEMTWIWKGFTFWQDLDLLIIAGVSLNDCDLGYCTFYPSSKICKLSFHLNRKLNYQNHLVFRVNVSSFKVSQLCCVWKEAKFCNCATFVFMEKSLNNFMKTPDMFVQNKIGKGEYKHDSEEVSQKLFSDNWGLI